MSEYHEIKAASVDVAGSGVPKREGQVTGPIPDEDRRSRVIPSISPEVTRGFLRTSELVLLVLSGAASAWAIQDLSFFSSRMAALVGVVLSLSAAYVLFAELFRLYRIVAFQAAFDPIVRSLAIWSTMFLTLLSVSFLTGVGSQTSQAWVVVWFFAGTITLVAFRISAARTIRAWAEAGRLQRNVIVVGGGKTGQRVIAALKAADFPFINISGVFDDRSGDRAPDDIDGVKKLGSFDELVRFSRSNRVDMLLVALPMSAERRMVELLKKLWVLPVDIRLSALDSHLRFARGTYSYIGNVPFLDIYEKPLTDWNYALKGILDRTVAALMLLASLPLFAIVAIAIKLESPGPVFFKQRRYGFNNELIEVYKFRTLKHEQADANASKLVTSDDDRVTRVGKWLRKSSIDELPQVITVLKGDMSVVGPRPHAVLAKAGDKLYGDVVDGYFARHRVKPGITGWAQINGWRGETDTDEKIERRTEFDLYYIDNWSLLFDIYIILRTPLALIKGENAY